MPTNTNDVTNTKGVAGGYGFSAPLGTTLPTDSDPFAALNSAFVDMGFISSDGIEEEIDADADTVTDLSGEVIYVLKSSETETLTLTLVSKSEAALREMFGHNAVTNKTGFIEVHHAIDMHDQRSYVFDLVTKGNKRLRKVVPNGIVSEVGSITYASSELYAREITITTTPDEYGVRIYDYHATTTTTTTGN